MRFSQDLIDRVREACDVVAVVSEHVQLRRAGRTWKGLCPFHQEKTPSFTVNPDRQIFKCFGCGEGGDVFRFLMEFEKLSFPEAVETLAGRAGIPLPQRGSGPGDESVYPVLEWAAQFYRNALAGRTGAEARSYLERRGVDKESIERFGIGWAPPGWSALLDAGRWSAALLERAGLALANDRGGHYDRFRARVVIPIRSALGRTIGFGARALGAEEPKYLNSPETELFHKGKVLYGLSEAREALKERKEALVVEGYMDAVAVSQAGFRNVVASCGTAFTEDQARVLRRYVDAAVLCFDGDLAGIRAAWKSAGTFLGAGLEVRIAVLPEGEDPDSLVRSRGREAFGDVLRQAPGIVGFARTALLDRLEKREDLLKALAYLGSRIDDAIRRRALLQDAAEQLRFDEATLVREALRLSDRKTASPHRAEAADRDRIGRAFLALLLSERAVPEEILVPAEAFREEPVRELYLRWLELRNRGEARPLTSIMEDDGARPVAAEILAEESDGATLADLVPRMRERARLARGKVIREAIQDAESRGNRDEVERLLKELQSLKLGT